MLGDHQAGVASSSIMGSSFTSGPRKLLRTLSTVSIHEAVDGVNGLVAKGPIGQAIIDRHETAADAPASEMPREFASVREEDEDVRSVKDRTSGSGSGGGGDDDTSGNLEGRKLFGCSSDSGSSTSDDNDDEQAHSHNGRKSAIREQKGVLDAKAADTASPTSQQKKKEKRFILF
jgi:hypothetical protein